MIIHGPKFAACAEKNLASLLIMMHQHILNYIDDITMFQTLANHSNMLV